MKININNIKLFGYHGVYNEEKEKGQYFILNIEYQINTDKFNSYIPEDSNSPLISDDIKDFIDYTDVINRIENLFNKQRFNLMESLLDYLANSLLTLFKFKNLKISIKKDFSNSISKINADSIKVEIIKDYE